MIQPTGYKLTCDKPDCTAELRHLNPFKLRNIAERLGWTFNRRLDGMRAIRGGKDYCPEHRRTKPALIARKEPTPDVC